MDFIQTIAGFVGALFILVTIHEAGHYSVARLCGVRVLRFCIGMGKPFVSFRDRHGTEFGLAPFPLGGYVKMLDEREGEVSEADRPYSYNSKSVWQRIAILAAGPGANFLLAFVIFATLVGFQGETDAAPVIGKVEAGSLADQVGLNAGQEILAVDGKPTATRQAVLEQLLMRLGETGALELKITDSGSNMAYETELPLNQWMRRETDPNPLQGLGIDFYYPPVTVAAVVEGSPAEDAGLAEGDIVLGADGIPVTSLQEWIDYVRARPGEPVEVNIERNGLARDLMVTPALVTSDDGAAIGQVGVQITYGNWPEGMIRRQSYGPLEAVVKGSEKTWDTSVFVLVSMKKLIFGEISTKNLSGPIGIAKVAGDRARAGIIYFVEFLALLSISLGVLNLLPIPILDGGHILYCLIEGIKGSPVSEKIQMMGYSAGIVMLAGVMLLALYNDILRL